MFSPPLYMHYIKKEDARRFFKQQRMRFGIVLMSMGLVIAGLLWQVVPKLTALYADLQLTLPALTQLMLDALPLVSIAGIGAGLYLALTNPDYSLLEPILNKYKKGELINSAEFPLNRKYELLILFLIAMVVGLLVTGVIAPIYSLTADL